MYKLMRFYNQNRKTIFTVILIIVFAIGGIQLLNFFAKTQKSNDNIQNVITDDNQESRELVSNKSLISGENISGTQLKKDTDVINEFVNYCNEKSIQSAYELLTDDCKEEMFPTIEDFYNIYYSKLFNEDKKIHTIENWVGNTYQVRFTGDILSTGNLSNNETREDYITIVKENGESKLNINNYIGRNNLNKITEYEDIKMTVTNVDTYMDYEIYSISIQNDSENPILLDTSDDTKSVYLLDSKDMKYYFYSNEIVENELLIQSKFKNTLKIKFTNSYSFSRRIDKLVFSKLVLNYNEYKILENKEEYEFCKFEVKI